MATPGPSSPSGQSPIPSLSPILWAFFLASSWTWCIGMFLPALLLRDAGWMGYVVFFLPNVIGAGAMGFVLRSPEAAARIAERHAPMCRLFSIVTLAFHAFWLAWLFGFFRDAFPIPDNWLMGAAAAGIAWIIVSGRITRAGAAPRAAAVLWIVALAAAIAILATPDALAPSTRAMIATPTHPDAALWLMPVCVFGFMLCPYLDLTFLLARRSTAGVAGGRIAFGLGFWIFFPVMIGLTALYAGPIIATLEGRAPASVAPWAGAAILFHIIAQWTFTVRVHLAALTPDQPAHAADDEDPDPAHPTTDDADPLFPGLTLNLSATFAACLGAAGLGLLAPALPDHAGLTGGEVIYRCFMSFYGLVFPVYVWARMIPRRRPPTHAAWITACILAAPFYWIGFIEREGIFLAPGLLIAMIVPLLWREKGATG
ncbi:MAG: hypothetical protein LAT64_06000 [Phycisphaerales bacterium]|nr:hypothetical protein [Planctomycetota bacterium]MCH8508307.1 hypothetical protein [Phycisphaerales bacterium]